MAQLKPETAFYRTCKKTAKQRGANALRELIFYLKNNPEVNIPDELTRQNAIVIAEASLKNYLLDVSLMQNAKYGK
jgi:hypothetical protein